MCRKIFFLCALFLLLGSSAPRPALPALYVWQDAGGRFHYTDRLENVPESQRDTARKILPEAPARQPLPARQKERLSAPPKQDPQPSKREKSPPEALTRRKAQMEQELAALRQSLAKEQAKLDKMARAKRYKWGIYYSQKEIVAGYQKLIEENMALLKEIGDIPD